MNGEKELRGLEIGVSSRLKTKMNISNSFASLYTLASGTFMLYVYKVTM